MRCWVAGSHSRSALVHGSRPREMMTAPRRPETREAIRQEVLQVYALARARGAGPCASLARRRWWRTTTLKARAFHGSRAFCISAAELSAEADHQYLLGVLHHVPYT